MEEGQRMIKIKIIALVIISSIATHSLADDCHNWQNKVNDFENAKRQGGSSNRMNYLQKQLDYYEEKLKSCRKETNNSEKITIYSGANKNQNYEEFLYSEIDNSQLQQMIKTCNYWIEQHNQNPSFENRSHKENSCRDAKNMESEIISPKERPTFIQTRSIKECIKPNSVIDRDVKLCMQGLKEPTWVTL